MDKHLIKLKSFNKDEFVMHEYGHFIDNVLGLQLYNENIYASSRGSFKKELDKLIKDHSNADLSYSKSLFIRDMINIITVSKIMPTGRPKDYWEWNDYNLYAEAFANIYAFETTGMYEELQWVEKNMPNVLKEYYKLLR
jgi:hypothetical protein